jgi:putative transposase
MAQYQITVDSDLLHQLFLKNSQDAGVASLLEAVLNQVLQAQATEQLNAEPYERTENRQGYRNGTYPHQLTTRVGTITLRVPRLRNGKFSTELFARYQRSEQALVLALMEMVVNGVSTRKVAQITEELCGVDFSKSTVSELCKRLDPIVTAWNERNLRDSRFPFLVVDALVLKVREEGTEKGEQRPSIGGSAYFILGWRTTTRLFSYQYFGVSRGSGQLFFAKKSLR